MSFLDSDDELVAAKIFQRYQVSAPKLTKAPVPVRGCKRGAGKSRACVSLSVKQHFLPLLAV